MSAIALAQALRALAPAGVTRFDGAVTGTSPALPWIVLGGSVPDVYSRSLARTGQANVGHLLVTVAAGNEDAALVIADKVLDAYEGVRPVADGWLVSPLEQLGDVKVFADDVVIAGTNRRVMVAKVTFSYTATRQP